MTSRVYHLSKSSSSLSKFLVITTSIIIKLENLKHYFTEVVCITKCIGIYNDLVPCHFSSHGSFGFRFVNRMIFSLFFSFTNNQKAWSWGADIGTWSKFSLSFTIVSFFFKCHDFYWSTLSSFSSLILNLTI